MGTDPTLSVFNNHGLLRPWDSFLTDSSNNFQTNPTAATAASPSGGLHCKAGNLWNLEFDTDAITDQFPSHPSLSNGTLLLPLSSSPATSQSRKLGFILDQFGVSENQQIPGDAGLLATSDTTPAAPSGLVNSVVQALSVDRLFQVDPAGRNAIWLTPGQILRTDVVLTFKVDSGISLDPGRILQVVLDYFNLTLPDVTVPVDSFSILLQRTCFGVQIRAPDSSVTWDVSTTFRLTFRIAVGFLIFWVTLEPTGLKFSVTQNPAKQNDDLSKLLPAPLSSIASALDSTVLLKPKLLQLSAGKTQEDPPQVWWRLLLGLKLGSKPTAPSVYLEYESLSKTFSGGLILGELKDNTSGAVLLHGFYASDEDRLLSTYQPGMDIDPPAGETASQYAVLRLGDISDAFSALPDSLPTAIALANIAYQTTTKSLWFSAKLIQPPKATGSSAPVPPAFSWDVMDLHLKFIGTDPKEIELSTHFTLTDPNPSNGVAQFTLSASFSDDDKTWKLAGHAQDLRLSMLYEFFDSNSRDGVLQILGKIDIKRIDVDFTYTAGSLKSFVFRGTVDIGKLELQMVYTYDPGQWKIEFDAGSSDGTSKLGDVIDSISDDAASVLPSFISGISIPQAGGPDSPITIAVERKDTRLFFAFRITLDHFTLSYVQVTQQDGSVPAKRLLRFSVNKIPLIPNVPLLNALPQPFDALEYMWASGSADVDGWKTSEVKALNDAVLTGADQIHYKPLSGQSKADAPKDGDSDIVIRPGHHFVVLNKGETVLDHLFSASGSPTGPPSTDSAVVSHNVPGGFPQFDSTITRHQRALMAASTDDSSSAPVPDSAPTKGALSFSFGPLSVTAITLQYKEQGNSKILALTMDATFNLDPITFSLLGFGIGVDLTGLTLDNLQDVASHLEVELHGMALSFNKPPLLIAGGFVHDVVGSGAIKEDIYLGGIGVSFPPYTFVGVGEYAVFQNYKSVFIYAKLDGPLITLGFATISGVRLGLGYNSSVRTPKLEEITQFPFVNDGSVSGAGNDPIKILNAMVQASPSGPPFVTPMNDSYWFAAGLTLIAFDILAVTAVAMVQFKEAGLIISIIADAVAQMPPGVTSRSEMIAYVELGFIAEMNMVDGYFRVEAALAPTSFLLVPQCRIYGGMALVYWFSPNAHAGDWVFTIGGYHRKFQVPEWYPTVQRLGISFSLGILSVTGETYFAITPNCAMGGALIHVTLTIGPVSAWLDAGFDALVNFHPLHYLVDFHVAVGVAFDADVWFVHIHISATVGAYLEIQGPQFGGTAHVDFCMFGFDVDFGASPHAPDPMSLLEFWKMLHKPGPNVQSQNQNDANPPMSFLSFDNNTADAKGPVNSHEDNAAFKFALEDGNFPMPSKKDSGASPSGNPTSTGAGTKWFVKGGTFIFRVSTDFALSKATVAAPDDSTDPLDQTVVLTAPDAAAVYSRPMQVNSPIVSELLITVKKISNKTTIQSGWRRVIPDMKQMPEAAFGQYDLALDPSRTTDPDKLLSGKNTTRSLMMGVVISSPLAHIDDSPILVANATAMMSLPILDFDADPNKGTPWYMQPFEAAQVKYLPAALTDAESAPSGDARWENMTGTWSALDSKQTIVNDKDNGLLTVCNQIFAWQKNQPQAATVTPAPAPAPAAQAIPSYQPWALKGNLPTKLINRLKDTYLSLPRIAAV